MWFISSCGIGKYLAEDQKLLVKNKLDFETKGKIEGKATLKAELESLYLQEPNGNVLGIPREWLYLSNAAPADTVWFNNWARDKAGEAPALHDSTLTLEAADRMQQYLRNKKGFYNALVQPKIDYDKHKAKVTYQIITGARYSIDSIFYICEDANILRLLDSIRSETLVVKGDPADAGIFDLEKNRMVVTLQNLGYADFVANYINIMGDSSNQDYTIDIFMEIQVPQPDKVFKKYTVGDIEVYTDYYKGQERYVLDSSEFASKIYRKELPRFLVQPSVIDNAIYLQKGELLTRRDRNKTFRLLSELETYRFVSMNPIANADDSNAIDYVIQLTPHQKKWIMDAGADTYYSNFTQLQRQLIGLGANTSLTNRNFLGGAERYKISLEGGVEFDPVNLNINRYNIGFDQSLLMPRLWDYGKIFSTISRLGIITHDTYEVLRKEAKTDLSLSYNRLGVVDFYNITAFNASSRYSYKPSANSQVLLKTTSFILNNYGEGVNFDRIVGDNPLIRNSFADNLITGYLFNQMTYLYNKPANQRGFSYSLLADLEISGLETYATNKLYNLISGTDTEWQLLDRFDFSKFVKIELDLRMYKQIRKGHVLASRVNLGIGTSYGGSGAIPFIRQFNVGGPISMRAWDQMELGPGGYQQPFVPGQLFYQQGDVKMEFNLEYRVDLFWILEAALFTDVGNVWTLKNDERDGRFGSDFYRELAIAAGWGIRWDFTFFNIRFDFGYRIRNPYPDESGRYWTRNPFKPSALGNLQVAVNYPF